MTSTRQWELAPGARLRPLDTVGAAALHCREGAAHQLTVAANNKDTHPRAKLLIFQIFMIEIRLELGYDYSDKTIPIIDALAFTEISPSGARQLRRRCTAALPTWESHAIYLEPVFQCELNLPHRNR